MFVVFKESNASKIADFYTAGLKDTEHDKLLQALSNSFGDFQVLILRDKHLFLKF
jgi:hypothetical protein